MELVILGSAAAEGWPALFCECEACAVARVRGGKDLRRRTSYRLGDSIQIDWGPDTFAASTAHGLDTSTITDLVVTHSHEDHFAVHELYYRRPGFSQVAEDSVLSIHGGQAVGDALSARLDDEARFRLAFCALEPYQEYALAEGVTVTPIVAAHAPDVGGAFNYVFRIGDRCLLIGNDTGWWDQEAWDYLATVTLDVVIMDCTYGPRRERRGHLGAHEVVEVRDELALRESLSKDCSFVANHFSHNGGWLHEDLEGFFTPLEIQVGYDGMVIEI